MQIIEDLESRIVEVELYFDFIEKFDVIEASNNQITLPNSTKYAIKRDVQKILRANCYLLLYNIIEATISNSISAIYDAIHDDNLCFDELAPNIANIWLSNKIYEMSEISNKNKVQSFFLLTVRHLMDKSNIKLEKSRVSISGNLDFRSIEKLCKDYGIFGKITADKVKLGKALLRVKNERNALAHGNKSFRKAAEIVTYQELIGYKKEILIYLRDISQNVKEFIENKKYKKGVPPRRKF